jgi:3-oxoacyl-[acyl-carrier-protein] synthase-3
MEITHNFLLLPKKKIDVAQVLRDSGKTKEESDQTIAITGIKTLCHAGDRLFSEFALSGLTKISETHANIFIDVDAVIVISQSYDHRIPSLSTRIQKHFNLKSETFCVDIMDGCSGYIKALSIASMLGNNAFRKVLIIAGDINSSMTINAELATKILFGDGLAVSVLEAGTQRLNTKLLNDGDTKNVISCDMRENIMHMNGFEVFRFTRNVVPKLVKTYLADANEDIDSYDLIALHQASDLVVSTISKMLKVNNRLIENFACGQIGNLGAGSIGAWLSQGENLTNSGKLKMLAVGFGSGLSWGLASLTVNLKNNEVIHV